MPFISDCGSLFQIPDHDWPCRSSDPGPGVGPGRHRPWPGRRWHCESGPRSSDPSPGPGVGPGRHPRRPGRRWIPFVSPELGSGARGRTGPQPTLARSSVDPHCESGAPIRARGRTGPPPTPARSRVRSLWIPIMIMNHDQVVTPGAATAAGGAAGHGTAK